jgi:transposase InsO family protein
VLRRFARKTPEIDLRRPFVVGLAVPRLERLALSASHRQAKNGHCLASRWLSFVLDLEGAARPTRTTAHFARSPRSDPQDVPGESRLGRPRIHGELLKLGIDIGESGVSKYTVRCRKPPSQTWRTFLENHAKQRVSIDFFTVPAIHFQVLYVFLVLAHDRRRILHFNVTAHPTAEWTGQQLREAFPFEQLPRYLLRDRDCIFGQDFREQVLDMGIRKVLSAPRSPWQRAYVERVIGSIRRECLDHVIAFHERSLRRTLNSVFRLLSPIENTSFVRERLTGATSDSAGHGVQRGGAAGRWFAPPLRKAGCLKNPNPPGCTLQII